MYIQSARADENAANMFKSKIQNKLVIGNVMIISLMTLGLIFLLTAVILVFLQNRKEKRLQTQDEKKNSYSSLPQKEVPLS